MRAPGADPVGGASPHTLRIRRPLIKNRAEFLAKLRLRRSVEILPDLEDLELPFLEGLRAEAEKVGDQGLLTEIAAEFRRRGGKS